ncbi:hypothetical protein GCM10007147_40120 [Nocardiopsis kunsanensis]|uniref:Uncharacterized protein n=1 Tax=Nocardiopsis kunsanensis TaxID=141693 RepID=A0A918XK09_9ACTN|nr:hypothetical protein GCM10007147_40120 [Nocardiopsis kunsanensis]
MGSPQTHVQQVQSLQDADLFTHVLHALGAPTYLRCGGHPHFALSSVCVAWGVSHKCRGPALWGAKCRAPARAPRYEPG